MDAYDVAKLIADQHPKAPKPRWGTVQSIAEKTLSVLPDGSTSPITVVRGCSPRVGGRVVMLVNGTEWIAVAQVGGDSVAPITSGSVGWLPVGYHVCGAVCTVGFAGNAAFTIAASDATIVGQLPQGARPTMVVCAPVVVYWSDVRLTMTVNPDGRIMVAAPVAAVHLPEAHYCMASATYLAS